MLIRSCGMALKPCGHAPVCLSANATWSRWLALSVFLPSQQPAKSCTRMTLLPFGQITYLSDSRSSNPLQVHVGAGVGGAAAGRLGVTDDHLQELRHAGDLAGRVAAVLDLHLRPAARSYRCCRRARGSGLSGQPGPASGRRRCCCRRCCPPSRCRVSLSRTARGAPVPAAAGRCGRSRSRSGRAWRPACPSAARGWRCRRSSGRPGPCVVTSRWLASAICLSSNARLRSTSSIAWSGTPGSASRTRRALDRRGGAVRSARCPALRGTPFAVTVPREWLPPPWPPPWPEPQVAVGE